MNEVLKAIAARRSIRKFLDKPVPKKVIDELLSSAVMSPSAVNAQPWRFVVVTDKAKIRELSDAVKRLTPLTGLPLRLVEKITSREDMLFYSAPLLILVCADKNHPVVGKYAEVDCGILSQTMFLAAHSLGLGSCFIGLALPLNNDKKLVSSLGVPSGMEIIAPLIFGYPAEEKQIPKKAFEDKVLKRF